MRRDLLWVPITAGLLGCALMSAAAALLALALGLLVTGLWLLGLAVVIFTHMDADPEVDSDVSAAPPRSDAERLAQGGVPIPPPRVMQARHVINTGRHGA